MNSSTEKVPAEPSMGPLNFIFACSVCGASFADVYEGHNETVQGLSDGINPKDRLVTRMFLANCSHVFCSSHLEGGGPPFHSAKERPRAPCPVCVQDKGNHEPQFLYSVRGFNKGEYDPLIPPSWFISPPVRLDGSGKEMDALRFQYIALMRYCQKSYATRKPLEGALQDAERKIATLRNLASEGHIKILSLKREKEELQVQNEQLRVQNEQFEAVKAELQRLHSIEHELEQSQVQKDQFEAMKAEVERLQSIEQQLEQFRKLNVNPLDLETFMRNKSAIQHYLRLVPMLIDQNEKMQRRLGQLGFAMHLEPIPNFRADDPSAFDGYEALRSIGDGDFGGILQKTASSHTAGRSTHASGRVGTTSSSPFARRPMKRQRLDSPLPKNMQIERHSGRHAMPPPAKPLSRMQSMRSMFPSLRKKFSTDRSSPVAQQGGGNDRDVHTIHDDGRCQTAKSLRQQVRNMFQGESPYMSGALPVEKTHKLSDSRDPRQPANPGTYENQSDVSFRASSPAKRDAHGSGQDPVQLVNEPSYIRLMDVLSNDNDVQLELKDPRGSPRPGYQDENMKRQVVNAYENPRALQGEDRQGRWSLGHDAFHQASNKSSVSVGTYRPHLQYGPTDVYANRHHIQPDADHAASTPGKHHLGNPIDTVVSPYFKSGHCQAQSYLPSGPAEPDGSSSHSVIYRSQRSPISKPQATWAEPRGLNGLSFFDFPVSPRNKPGKLAQSSRQVDLEPMFSSSHQQSRFLDSSGFIRRPETEYPQCWKDEAYTPLQTRTSHARQLPGHSRAGANPSSQKLSTYNRFRDVLPTVPSIIPPASSVHSQSQWKKLQRAGVRSSRNAPGDLVRNELDVSSQQMFPVSGRRNIIR